MNSVAAGGGKSVLLTNYHLRALAGSELVTLDLAKLFRGWDWDVAVAAWDIGQPMLGLFRKAGVEVVRLDDPSLQRDFELLWAHHWPTIAAVMGSGNLRVKQILFSSLGAPEGLEAPPFNHDDIDLYLGVSQKVLDRFASYGFDQAKIMFLPTSLPREWFDTAVTTSKGGRLLSIACVSNHVPEEMSVAMQLLSKKGISAHHIGEGGDSVLVTPDLLRQYDAVVSIGRTVVQAMAVRVPVFCYDVFGGPGWMLPETVEQASLRCFSGKDVPRHMSCGQIADQVAAGFASVQERLSELQAWVHVNCSLEKNVMGVLRRLQDIPQRHAAAPSGSWLLMSRYAECVLRLEEEVDLRKRQITAMQSTRGWKVLETVRRARARLGGRRGS